MGKKVGLISVYSDPNYGSLLQAYALYAVLKELKCDSEYLRCNIYTRSRLKKYIKQILFFLRLKKRYISEYSYWSTKDFRNQRNLFNDFQKEYIPTSRKCYNKHNISRANEQYASFIVGSDQTWSPLVTQKNGFINFLSFVDDSKKKNAYAPSIGTTSISEDYLKCLKEKLSDFSFISCREKKNASLLSGFISKEVEYVLDPTLLLRKNAWLSLAEPIKMPSKYVLCYILGTKECIYNYASLLGKSENIPVYIIVTRPEYIKYENCLKDISVGQFISLICNASYVITDSFHGSMFCLNFGTNFYSFTKREHSVGMNDNDRIGDFLNIVGLTNRLKHDNDLDFEEDIDFGRVNKVLDPLRFSSLSYLKRVIGSIK